MQCVPALSYTKTVDQTAVTGGDDLTWTITVYNTGALATTEDISITDYISSTLSDVVITPSAGVTCGASTNPLSCTVSAGLAAYTGSASITISATTSEYLTTSITNTATVQYDGTAVTCD